MAVYVDSLFQTPTYRKSANERWNWKQSCHMVASSEEELHAMAKRLGLKPEWFQDKEKNGTPYANRLRCHYDLTENKHAMAVRYGAIEITTKQASDRLRGIPIDISPDVEQAPLFG